MTNRHWSGKYVTYADGDTMWVRADYADKLRDTLVAAGRIETGKSLVTGGKTYLAFVAA